MVVKPKLLLNKSECQHVLPNGVINSAESFVGWFGGQVQWTRNHRPVLAVVFVPLSSPQLSGLWRLVNTRGDSQNDPRTAVTPSFFTVISLW